MIIAIVSSMHHTERMLSLRDALADFGHVGLVTSLAEPFIGQSDEEKERIKIDQKMNQDAMREFFPALERCDAVLVLNLERKGIPHYIGGNTFLEMSIAYYLHKPIFLFEPIPDVPYSTEIEAMRPVIIHGDLSNIVITKS
jgi:hypothetical protein